MECRKVCWRWPPLQAGRERNWSVVRTGQATGRPTYNRPTHLLLQDGTAKHLNGHFTERVEGTREEACEHDRPSRERALGRELEVVVRGTNHEGQNLKRSQHGQHGRGVRLRAPWTS